MHVNTEWALGVTMMFLLLGTPQVSRTEATISFSSRYYYFCWNPSAQGKVCSQRTSKTIWTVSHVPVEVELRAECQQQHYAQVFYAPEESRVIETFNAECGHEAQHRRLRREVPEQGARQDVSQ